MDLNQLNEYLNKVIDEEISKCRDTINDLTYGGKFETIDSLPLSETQKKCVLEWFAYKLWRILEEGSGEPDYWCKSYDPLQIGDGVAHSYALELSGSDGGRHHNYEDLRHLEVMLTVGAIQTIEKDIDGVEAYLKDTSIKDEDRIVRGGRGGEPYNLNKSRLVFQSATDSTKKPIQIGDTVKFRGQQYTIKDIIPLLGRNNTCVIRFNEKQHTTEPADEMSVDFISRRGES